MGEGSEPSVLTVISNEPAITPELIAQHGLKPDEYERIVKLIGRAPMVKTSRKMPPTPVVAP